MLPQDGIAGVQRARRTLVMAALCIPTGLVVTAVTCRVALGWATAGDGAAAHRTAVFIQGAGPGTLIQGAGLGTSSTSIRTSQSSLLERTDSERMHCLEKSR